MARNRYPGTCYCCGEYVPTGFGHFERYRGHWRIKCVNIKDGDWQFLKEMGLSANHAGQQMICRHII